MTGAAPRSLAASPPGALALAALLVRFRLRYLWNGVRARGRGRFPTLVVLIGLVTSVAYVGLFAQAFGAIVAATGVAGQLAALAVVTGTIAFGSLMAKAASSEAVLAGSAENEFLLARPIALPTLVTARCLAESATDPFGALFLCPVLLAAAVTWGLSPVAWLVAALTSLLTQVALTALAQATQIAVVRFVPRARRRGTWMALRLAASLSLAALWMTGTWVLRAPAELARALAPLAPWTAASPARLIIDPLAAVARGSAGGTVLALARLALGAGAAVLLAAAVAGRAGMSGWEEAGAPWAEAAPRPPRGRPLTAATKDLRLITRDRAQLLALVSMPVIFVGVQLFGAAGWRWSTATLQRVAYLTFSLTLYLTTIGPLAHMQAERRAFWILRTVPVPVGRLLAAKARAWSLVVGGAAAVVFTGLSLGAPVPDLQTWLAMAALVIGGAVGMTWLAIALAARAADLSDDQRPAIGPATIYVFLLVGGLFNVVIRGDLAMRARGLVLYAFALGAYWLAGVEQATICLDPERSRARRVTLADGATMAVVFALGQQGAEVAARLAGEGAAMGVALARVAVVALVGLAALVYLVRRPGTDGVSGTAVSAMVAVTIGAAAGLGIHALGFLQPSTAALFRHPVAALAAAGFLLGEDVLFRGVIQRAAEETARRDTFSRSLARGVAACVSLAVALVAVGGAPGMPLGVLAVTHAAATATRALTGRVLAAWVGRLITWGLAVGLALATAGPGIRLP